MSSGSAARPPSRLVLRRSGWSTVQRKRMMGGIASGASLKERNDAGHVAEIDEPEEREKERGPTETITTHRLHDDAVFDELDGRLGMVARTAWCLACVGACGQREDRAADDRCEHGDDGDLVERRCDVLPAQNRVDGWEIECDHVCFLTLSSCALSFSRTYVRRGLVRGGWAEASDPGTPVLPIRGATPKTRVRGASR